MERKEHEGKTFLYITFVTGKSTGGEKQFAIPLQGNHLNSIHLSNAAGQLCVCWGNTDVRVLELMPPEPEVCHTPQAQTLAVCAARLL